jgi:tetratricopeptide (TPR) repeat protein
VRNATRCLLALVVAATALAPVIAAAQGYTRPMTDYGRQPKKSGLAGLADSIGSGMKRGANKVSQSLNPAGEPVDTADPTRLSNNATPGPDLYIAVARTQEERKRYHEAEEQYAKALGGWPDHLPSMLAYAGYLDRRGHADQAIQQYEQAVRTHPREAAAWNHLGLCHAEHRGFAKAASALEQAIALEPTEPLYRNNLASVLVEMGRNGDAYSQLHAVQDEATAYYNLGFLLQERGRNEEAARHFAAALRANPQLSDARTWLDHLQSSYVARPPQSQPVTTPGRPSMDPVAVALRPTVAAQPPVAEPSVAALPQLTAPGQSLPSMPPAGRSPIRVSPAVPTPSAVPPPFAPDRREASGVQQLPPVPRSRPTETPTAVPGVSTFRPRPAPALPRLASPDPTAGSGMADRMAEPERTVYPDPSAPAESRTVAPLPPVSPPRSTKSYGTPGTNVVYPLPPVEP